jgi:hypothetical protein
MGHAHYRSNLIQTLQPNKARDDLAIKKNHKHNILQTISIVCTLMVVGNSMPTIVPISSKPCHPNTQSGYYTWQKWEES